MKLLPVTCRVPCSSGFLSRHDRLVVVGGLGVHGIMLATLHQDKVLKLVVRTVCVNVMDFVAFRNIAMCLTPYFPVQSHALPLKILPAQVVRLPHEPLPCLRKNFNLHVKPP